MSSTTIEFGSLTPPPAVPPGEERFDTLVRTGSVRVERVVSLDARSPEGFWYEQETEEWVLVVTGSACVVQESPPQRFELAAGQWIQIPAKCRHRVESTSPDEATVWVAIHYRPD